MGFWHTGYIEFKEPTGLDFKEPTGLDLPVPRPPARFVCEECGESFSSPEDRANHRFSAHPKHGPAMVVQGRQLGADRLLINRPLVSSDVRLDCDLAWLNGAEVPIGDVPVALAGRPATDMCRVTLRKDGIDTDFNLKFCIASADDLERVDRRFEEIVLAKRLDSGVVDDFIGRKSEYGTAIGYCDGICSYLYGVIAKEQNPDRNDYESKFNNAAEKLAGYDRQLARTIRSLIEFHFNHFAESVALAPDSRVGAISTRYAQWIHSDRGARAGERGDPSAKGKFSSVEERPDRLLTDEVTERIVRWSMCPLSKLSGVVERIESRLRSRLPAYDRAKLCVLLGEFHAEHGPTHKVSKHARALRNVEPFEDWASQLLNAIRR